MPRSNKMGRGKPLYFKKKNFICFRDSNGKQTPTTAELKEQTKSKAPLASLAPKELAVPNSGETERGRGTRFVKSCFLPRAREL